MWELILKNLSEEVLEFFLNALDLEFFVDIVGLEGPKYKVFKFQVEVKTKN